MASATKDYEKHVHFAWPSDRRCSPTSSNTNWQSRPPTRTTTSATTHLRHPPRLRSDAAYSRLSGMRCTPRARPNAVPSRAVPERGLRARPPREH
eukprot:8025094-Pyramimonas_sp.AAC.1